jgi:hypothetical protein
LERVSASFSSLHWTYSLHTASLSASTVHPSTLGWGFDPIPGADRLNFSSPLSSSPTSSDPFSPVTNHESYI